MKNSINIKICGQAGEGIKTIGLILSKGFVKAGYWTFDYTEYPSLIRGGHNTYQINVSTVKVYSQVEKVDILLCFNKESYFLHQDELTNNSIILFDSKININPTNLLGKFLILPFEKIALKIGAQSLMANIVALGCICQITGLDISCLNNAIKTIFKDKTHEVINLNLKAAMAGYRYNLKDVFRKYLLRRVKKNRKITISGNEAISLGAISAGMKFYSAYPMTPVTGILHYLAAKAKEYNLVVKHAEDEISVINMALGASFAGVRSMIGTSGGGFCLMTEGLSLAGMMELPIVIIEGMRSGPSTGMPTWHDQADLNFVLHAGHGDFPRMVLAPGDFEEAFQLTRSAFYFAEKYQLPVIVLTDKYLSESNGSIYPFKSIYKNERYSFNLKPNKAYKRYQVNKFGISFRTIPGQENGIHIANSYEHDEFGFTTEEIEKRIKQVEKRIKKQITLSQELAKKEITVYGNPKAKIGLISFGSNKGPILQSLQNSKLHSKIAFINLMYLLPFPIKQVASFLKNKNIIDIECNSTGHLARLIKEQTGIDTQYKLLKYDGRPFYPEEIISKLSKLVKLN